MSRTRRTAPQVRGAAQRTDGKVNSHDQSTADHRQEQDLTRLVGQMADGKYRPQPGTLGERLLEIVGACDWHGSRSIGAFARVALRREGLFWPVTLNSDPALLPAVDVAYAEAMWRAWAAGAYPFRGRRGHAA